MYLKYVPSGTKVAESIRDIARTIHQSSSGTASLSNLEFCNTISSSLTTGTNSGWSLASGYTLGSGTTGSGDTQYAFVADTNIGNNKMYCSLHSNGDWANASEISGTFGAYNSGYGFTLSGLIDFGLSTEMYSHGRTTTSASYGGGQSFSYYPTSGFPAEFHVFAGSKYIVIAGSTPLGHQIIQGVCELEDNFMSADVRSTISHAVPHCFFQITSYGYQTIAAAVSRYRGDANAHSQPASGPNPTRQFFQMVKDRAGYIARNYSVVWIADTNSTIRETHTVQDGSTTGSVTPPSSLGAYNKEYMYNGYMANDTKNTMSPYHRWNPPNSTLDMEYGNTLTRNAAGTADQIPLYPLVHSFDNLYGGLVVNMSKYMPLYVCPYDLGSYGDTFTVGSDTYIFLGGTWRSSYKTAYMMKVE